MPIYRFARHCVAQRLVLGCLTATLWPLAAGAVSVNDVQRTEIATVSEGAASQARIDQIDDATEQAVSEYRAVLAQIANLTDYNDQLDRLITAQSEEMQSITEQLEQVTSIDRTVVPLMYRMIDGLEQFVSLDLPFLMAERSGRIADLRTLMERSDTSPAEKFRKILEAYEIENEYGRTIEAYQGPLPGAEDARTVNFLKYGRVALVYQTFDGAETAMWDQNAGQWVALDSSFTSPVKEGIRVARQQVPPSLLVLPVKSAQE